MRPYHRCPACAKKGAYIKSHARPSGDWWHCRYCHWTTDTDSVFEFRTGRWLWELDPAWRPGG